MHPSSQNILRACILVGPNYQRGVLYKMVMSIGWNPYFDNTEKTIEPWLLHKFDEDFYGEELHLVIVGYIRPEVCFIY
ncbi:putative riboflavin kinase [Helianthus debilis subsp. tardiflorus]